MVLLFFLLMYLFSFFFFFSSRRRHTRLVSDWSSDVCSSDLEARDIETRAVGHAPEHGVGRQPRPAGEEGELAELLVGCEQISLGAGSDELECLIAGLERELADRKSVV